MKPANIKIAGSTSAREIKPGAVKILDFGLAKALAPEPERRRSARRTRRRSRSRRRCAASSSAPRRTCRPSRPRGEPADQRADIWAFGVCLLEALTGRRVFGGSNASLILASVLKDEPDLAALPASTPAAAAPTAATLPREGQGQAPARHRRRPARSRGGDCEPGRRGRAIRRDARRRPRLLVAVAALGLLVLGGVVGGLLVSRRLRPVARAAPVARFVLSEPAEVVGTNPGNDLAIAGDGSAVAYLAQTPSRFELRLRRLDQLESAAIVSMDGPASMPFFSPDDRWVGYWDVIGRAVRKVSTLGGPSVRICDAEPDGSELGTGRHHRLRTAERSAAARGRVWRGAPGPDDARGRRDLRTDTPTFLPGGRAVLFAVLTRGPATGAILAVLARNRRAQATGGRWHPAALRPLGALDLQRWARRSSRSRSIRAASRSSAIRSRCWMTSRRRRGALRSTPFPRAARSSTSLAGKPRASAVSSPGWTARDERSRSECRRRTTSTRACRPTARESRSTCVRPKRIIWVWDLEREPHGAAQLLARHRFRRGVEPGRIGPSSTPRAGCRQARTSFRLLADGTGEPVRLTDQSNARDADVDDSRRGSV